MAVLVSASPTFVFYQNQILSKYHLNTIFVAFYSATHLKMSLIELFASNTEGQCQQMVSSQSQSVIIFFSIHSYPQFDFSEILSLLCPGSSIWFYLYHIDFRTGRRSPKCCWCFIAASLSQGVFATTEILTFTSKNWRKKIHCVFFFRFALFWSSFQKHGKPCAINWNNLEITFPGDTILLWAKFCDKLFSTIFKTLPLVCLKFMFERCN